MCLRLRENPAADALHASDLSSTYTGKLRVMKSWSGSVNICGFDDNTQGCVQLTYAAILDGSELGPNWDELSGESWI